LYAVPASCSVVFPRPASPGTYAVPVTLASLALPEFAGVAGFPGVKVLRSGVAAADDGAGGAADAVALAGLARQASQDWYLWQLGRADLRREGFDCWKAEAHSEVVEFEHHTGRLSTRATRGRRRRRAPARRGR